jgi:hypothetical protein
MAVVTIATTAASFAPNRSALEIGSGGLVGKQQRAGGHRRQADERHRQGDHQQAVGLHGSQVRHVADQRAELGVLVEEQPGDENAEHQQHGEQTEQGPAQVVTAGVG